MNDDVSIYFVKRYIIFIESYISQSCVGKSLITIIVYNNYTNDVAPSICSYIVFMDDWFESLYSSLDIVCWSEGSIIAYFCRKYIRVSTYMYNISKSRSGKIMNLVTGGYVLYFCALADNCII